LVIELDEKTIVFRMMSQVSNGGDNLVQSKASKMGWHACWKGAGVWKEEKLAGLS